MNKLRAHPKGIAMKTIKGFTLIELMITVAVIGILLKIGLPAYTDYVKRGKLVEGTSTLSDARVKMEQFYNDNRTYAPASVALTAANGCPTAVPIPAATTNFTYACGNLAATSYTITATGIGSLNGFTYTIDQDNAKKTTNAPAGWAAPTMPATCWIGKKGGAC
jgi:type IV pilus assembly protein PilE